MNRVDILHELLLLSQYQYIPLELKLEQVLHIFVFMTEKPKLALYMDSSLPSMEYYI